MSSDSNVYVRQGYGQRLSFGRRPALVVIDFTNGFLDPTQFGGGNIMAAVDNTVPLLAAARASRIPVVFSRHAYAADGSDHGLFILKNPRLKQLVVDFAATAVTDKLAPKAGERVLTKQHPSVFFGTDLIGWLAMRQVDTLIVSGCTTSGCVRASVVDALGFGLRPIVVRECVGDRALIPHEANLFDMEQKYADIFSLKDTLKHL